MEFFKVSNTTFEFDKSANSQTLEIESNCSWELKCDASWVTFTITKSGEGKVKNTLSVIENESPIARSAVAEIYNEDYGVSVEMLLRGTMGHQIVNLNALAVSGKKDVTSAYVENGDWLRLSRFSVGYDIPLRLKWLDRLNVNVSAVDMLTLTSYSGWNPDVSSYGPGVASGGYDYGSLPMAKRVVIGICAKF